MSKYTGIQKEETLKSLIFKDFFDGKKFGYEPNIDNIDFVVTDAKTRGDLFAEEGSGASVHYLWAEAKKGVQDVFEMLTQLVLTCKGTYLSDDYPVPPFLGCFDTARIAFVAFSDALPIFHASDFNWNTTPSDHESPEFQKALKKVKETLGAKITVFNFGADDAEINAFIKNNLFLDNPGTVKIPITKDNFVKIYHKWNKDVCEHINISKETWMDFKNQGVLECDFFLADLMSRDGNTIFDKLKIILKSDMYKIQTELNGLLFTSDINFNDQSVSYRQFWNRYERPPEEEYQHFILDRRDLLVPPNIREIKGDFYTPEVWVKKSQEYLLKVFGHNLQEEYYIWDCAAGTGNLLVGITKKYNVWASTISQGDVALMNARIDTDKDIALLPGHVFQFDFLNDSFDKLPAELKKIISDPEKQKKLIVYINPPYAEASSYGFAGKPQVANETKVFHTYKSMVGAESMSELFAQFFIRIYHLFPHAKLASFATPVFLTSTKFIKFRTFFKAECKAGFICRANTFDNVHGNFPISFLVWDFENKKDIAEIQTDIISNDNKLKEIWNDGVKKFYPIPKNNSIAHWRKEFYDDRTKAMAYIIIVGSSMQSDNNTFITSNPAQSYIDKKMVANITEKNIINMSIYFSVRQCVAYTWINNQDRYLYPNDGYKTDFEFQNDSLICTLFHGKNFISSSDFTNHWIPFTEEQVDAKEKFESNFMSGFLKDRTLSAEAQSVLDAGLALWRYYHEKTKGSKTASVNASFYDIREHFQGRNDKGTMNSKSTDETYTRLLGALRDALKTLTLKIQPKVYEYGFLRE